MVVTKSNVTHSKLESLDKTDGLLDRAANVEVVDGDLARGRTSIRKSAGADADRRLLGSLCRVARIMWARDRWPCHTSSDKNDKWPKIAAWGSTHRKTPLGSMMKRLRRPMPSSSRRTP